MLKVYAQSTPLTILKPIEASFPSECRPSEVQTPFFISPMVLLQTFNTVYRTLFMPKVHMRRLNTATNVPPPYLIPYIPAKLEPWLI